MVEESRGVLRPYYGILPRKAGVFSVRYEPRLKILLIEKDFGRKTGRQLHVPDVRDRLVLFLFVQYFSGVARRYYDCPSHEGCVFGL
jgi:hypothetical protein